MQEKEEKTVKATLDNRVYTIGTMGNNSESSVLSGYIRDGKTGEPIAGASVMYDGNTNGVSTDAFGFYTITLPKGRQVIRVSYVGMLEISRQVNIVGKGKMDLELKEEIRSLKTALVVAQKNSNLRALQMGVERLNLKAIKQIPSIFGETDIMRSLLSLPGVTSVGEGTVGYNVRGGAADQNLILLNDMTIYNPTHIFGLFSAVDPDAIRGVELYKSAIPEKFGSRISSIMDINTKDGNSKEFAGNLGIGPLTSRFLLEGPIKNDKSTFLIGGRMTYSDWLLKKIPDPSFKNSAASFYDLILHLTHKISDNDQLYLTAYSSKDGFKLNSDSTYSYLNRNFRMKWKHVFSEKFYHVFSAGADQFQYSIDSKGNSLNAFTLRFGISQFSAKSDFKFIPNNKHELSFGAQLVAYTLQPGSMEPIGSASKINPKTIEEENATESALYLGDQFKLNNKFSIQAGVRYVFYRKTGAGLIYHYQPGEPLNASTVIDSVSVGNGGLMQSYGGPEIRVSGRWLISPRSSLKFGFNTIRQFIHVITNSTALSPTDIWKLSDTHIKPQEGRQVSIGYFWQPGAKSIEISIETYYKTTAHYLDYKSGAQLTLNKHLERDVINTNGKAYGIEFQIKKNIGKINGWLSYTYLRSFLKMDDPIAGEIINNNNYYPANFDKPHILNLIANYKFTQRVGITLNTTYSTGRPITFPIGIFDMAGAPRVFYSARNAYRIPNFFRTDFSMNIENSPHLKQRFHTSWTFGIYNITGRDNPYSIYYTLENGRIRGYQLSVFATAIPFATFNLKF